jgi:Major tropism determinant N-terminal domain
MATRMQQRRGTAAQWTAANPILAAGEIGFETDTSKFKMGNGSSTWSALTYFANAAELANIIDGAPDLLNTLNELAAAIGDDPDFINTVAQGLTAHQNDSTMVHGIVDTALLATTGDVASAASGAAIALSAHEADTTLVHGIADTSLLATTGDVNAVATAASAELGVHEALTEDVHGIADTSLLATTGDITTHNSATENVHGILDTSLLVTQQELADAVSNAEVNQADLAGVGIDWNSADEQFDIDSTVATKTYADDAVTAHNDLTQNVHGIADTSLLATQSYADDAETDAITAAEAYTDLLVGDASIDGTTGNTVAAKIADVEDYVDSQIDSHVSVTTNVHGIADTTKIVLKDALSTTLDGALIVEGNLTVNGTNFAASATSITIEDNMLQLAHENAANTVDLGLVVGYNDGAAKHSGIVRDVSADSWKLFKGVTTEPTTTVDFTQGSLDNLALNNVTVAGVVFTDGTQSKEGVPSRTPIVQKTASYSLSELTHRDSMIEVSSTSGTTITIPAEASVNYPIGTTIDILQTNTGQVTIAGAAGVTVNATPGLKLRTRWSSATLMKRAADTWVVYGDLTA